MSADSARAESIGKQPGERGGNRPPSPPGDGPRKLLRLAAAAVVLFPVASVGYEIVRTPPTYVESATIEFSLPKSQTAPNAYYMFAPSLIMSGEAITQILISPQTQRRIRELNGTARVSLALVNLYNQQFPNYGEPLATLTASSPSAADSRRTFMVAAGLLEQLLKVQQDHAGVPPRNRISAQVIGESGPIVQAGSPKRVFAGLALLAVMAVSIAWGILDRRAARRARPSPDST